MGSIGPSVGCLLPTTILEYPYFLLVSRPAIRHHQGQFIGKTRIIMKTKLHHLFIALVLFAGVHPALAQTTPLSIAQAGNQAVISWPAAATNCFLQSTTNLSPAVWSTVTNAPVVISGHYTVTNPISGKEQFYQLSQIAIPAGMALIPAGVFTDRKSVV